MTKVIQVSGIGENDLQKIQAMVAEMRVRQQQSMYLSLNA